MLRRLLGLALLPLAWGLTRATFGLFPAVFTGRAPRVSPPVLAMFAGYLLWLLLFILLPSPVRAYIWGHELTHAVWGRLTGSRVGRIEVGDEGGSVRVSHPGLFTTLAPYFVPFYTVLVILLRLLLGVFFEMGRWELAWLFLVGFTWGFHLTFTVRSLGQHQPDIHECGWILSHVLIYLFNVVGFGLWIVAVTPATLPAFSRGLAVHTRSAYVATLQTVTDLPRVATDSLMDLSQKISRKHLIDPIQ